MFKTSIYLITAVISAIAIQGKAVAADMQVAPMYSKAPPMAVDLWTGTYIGVSAGGRWTSDSWSTTGTYGSTDYDSSSARLGVYGGYNWQVQPDWIVGIEADIAWANNHASINSIPGLSGGSRTGTSEVKDNADGGIRARVGYLVAPDTMLFATGGVSWIQSEVNATSITTKRIANWCAPDTIVTTRGADSASSTNVGWTLGGGIEKVVAANWLLRGEYRYSSYGSQKVSLMQGAQRFEAELGSHSTQTAMIGIAYQFGK